MKSPITSKEMSLVVRETEVEFRKEVFNVKYPSYYCTDSEQYFTTTDHDTIKMKQVYNQYRDKYNFPFPEEIKNIRSDYSLTARKMSEILGFGINGYRNYENGEVPSRANANLIQLASDPSKFKALVEISSSFDTLEEKENLLQKIESLIQEKRENIFAFGFYDYLLGRDLPDNLSGYLTPTFEKLTEMVIFFASSMSPYVTKLNKLLFYSDFLNYKYHAVSMSGTRYRAIDMGPVPNNYDSIFDYMYNESAVDIIFKAFDRGTSKQFKQRADRPFNKSLFSESELAVLNFVDKKFKKVKTKEIIEFSHLEDAWRENFHNGKTLIDYNYAFNLNI